MHGDESSVWMLNPQESKARRDILSSLFSRRAVLDLEDVILRKARAPRPSTRLPAAAEAFCDLKPIPLVFPVLNPRCWNAALDR